MGQSQFRIFSQPQALVEHVNDNWCDFACTRQTIPCPPSYPTIESTWRIEAMMLWSMSTPRFVIVQTLISSTHSHLPGRPRPYRSTRRSRIPQLEFVPFLQLPRTASKAKRLTIHSSQTDFDAAPGGPKIQPDTGTSRSNPFLSTGPAAPKRPMLSLSFYTQFFDVDTNEVLRRCWAALYPRAPFLDVLDGNPDLYGPFWIATTVVFILFLAGTINAKWGRLSGDPGADGDGFEWALLSGSAGLIYIYTGLVPVGLWAVLRWFGSESANLLECWCLYGYANLIWIPVAIISWSW